MQGLKPSGSMLDYSTNALFVADYLTEPGQQADMDWQMIEDMSFEMG